MRLALLLVLLMLAATPAEAHRLRVFATVEDGTIRGHAFFVGGGRPAGAPVAFLEGGTLLHETTTDTNGAFAWRPPTPGAITVRVEGGDGHSASVTLGVERFGLEQARAEPGPMPENAATPPLDPALQAAIEAAVARQVAPLLEAAHAAESRLRFNDVVGGIGMIVGLAGVALWAMARIRNGGGTR